MIFDTNPKTNLVTEQLDKRPVKKTQENGAYSFVNPIQVFSFNTFLSLKNHKNKNKRYYIKIKIFL